MIKLIITLFIAGLRDIASSKTMKYFIGDNKGRIKAFIGDTVNVIYTLMFIRSIGKAVVIDVDGEQRSVTEYIAPQHIGELIKYARVWATPEAVERATSLYSDQVCGVDSFEIEGEMYQAKLVTPEKVAAYFRALNRDQDEEMKVITTSVEFKNDTVLSDFKSLCIENGQVGSEMVTMNESGTIDEKVAFFNEVVCPFDEQFVIKHAIGNEEVLARWLVSVK